MQNGYAKYVIGFLIILFFTYVFLVNSGCKEKSVMDEPVIEEPVPETPAEPEVPEIPTIPAKTDACEVEVFIAKVRSGDKTLNITLPATGKMVLESHLRTKSDINKWPTTSTEGIEQHLTNACKAMRKIDPKLKADCSDLYDSKYEKVWTPAEGGKIGQGSVGELLPTVEQEMLSGNMNWRTKPKPGSKFLAQYGSKAVVFVMGFETGPGDTDRWLGGLQPEVHHLLGTGNNSQIKISYLKNQDTALGPIQCN